MDTNTLEMTTNKESKTATLQPEEGGSTVNVLDLIVARVRLRAMLRVAWLRKLWQESGNENGQPVNIHQTIDNILWNKDNREAEVTWLAEQDELQMLKNELEEVEAILKEDQQSYFAQIHLQLGVNEQESNILQTVLALSVVPELARVFAYLQDHSARNYVTDALVQQLFETAELGSLSPASPLIYWDIIRKREFSNGEPTLYDCDPHILNRLLNKSDMDAVLLGIAHVQQPLAPLPNWPVESTLNFISKTIESNAWQRVNIDVSGFEGSGRKTYAATVCEQLNIPLMVIDIDRIPENQWEQVYIHANRNAYLDICALAWTGEQWDNKPWPKIIAPFQIQFTITEPGIHRKAANGIITHQVELPAFSIEERRAIWQQLVPVSAEWPAAELEAMINRYQLTIGQINEVAMRAFQTPEEAIELLSSSSRHRFGKLAQYLECPFHWEDLILKDWLKNHLSDFVFEAKEREALWENHAARRLFPQGKGLMALFSGPPGTGKTMAAQVIAASLGLDLYRIDLSSIVSKYVGETSKNLEQILSRAGQINAVILFDEADALFGKRTEIKDAHDRYANTDTNYLLQAIESYSGIAVLATNKKSNIDSGFLRRLRYVLEFQKPDAEQRLQLWCRILGELAGEGVMGRLEQDLEQVAKMVTLTGAQIKFVVLSALFLSRKEGVEIAMPHLLEGMERELLKEGRNLSNDVKKRFLKQ